jgi:hypothetical protein
MRRRLLSLGVTLFVVAAAAGGMPAAKAEGGGSISGHVINDLNGDGFRQPREAGVNGWRVVLYGPAGMVAETRTGRDGGYEFSDLIGGAYRILLPCDGQPVANWIRTAPRTIRTDLLTPYTSDVDLLVQIPAEPLRTDGEITGKIVNDLDRDGTPDRGERGLAGWRVAVYRLSPISSCPGQEQEVFTYVIADSQGVFDVKGLVEGTYLVGGQGGVGPPDEQSARPTAWIQTCPVSVRTEPGLGDTLLTEKVEVKLDKGAMKASTNQCIAPLVGDGSISGEVFIDQNRNLVHDPDEPPTRPLLMALHYVTKRGLMTVEPWWAIPPLKDGKFAYQGLAGGHYVLSAYVGWLDPPILHSPDLTLARGQAMTNVNLAVPPAAPTPAPIARPAPAQPAIGAPSTGDGGVASAGDGTLLWAAAALSAAGVVGLAQAVRRRARRL